jgi:hypothetical protein
MTEKGGAPPKTSKRQQRARQKREAATQHQIDGTHYDVPSGRTPDELKFPRFAASFHKLLAHDPDGLLSNNPPACDPKHRRSGVENYKQLLEGLDIDAPSSDFISAALTCLELCNREPPHPPNDPPRPRVLINPRASKAFSIKGPDITSLRVSKLLYLKQNELELLREISLSSNESAVEMIELYAMAMLRDVKLGHYSGSLVKHIVDALNECGAAFVWGYDADGKAITAATRRVDEANLFRGPTDGDLAGEYLSVFLTFPRPPLFPSGCASDVADLIGAGKFARRLSQKLLVPKGKSRDFGRTREQYVCIQNSYVPEIYEPDHFSNHLTEIVTGRHLGDYVHVDNVYEEYIRAADILVGNAYPRTPQSPYTRPKNAPDDCKAADQVPWYRNEGDGPTLGPSDIYSLLGGVREVAERAAFTQKWLVARRARPEVMAALIDLALHHEDGDADGKKIHELLSTCLTKAGESVSKLLDEVADFNEKHGGENNLLLSQMYPEGSPSHPAWPSGHATVAGACVTILKALFDESSLIRDPDTKVTPAHGKPAGCQPPLDQVERKHLNVTVGGELDKLASNVAFGRNFGGVHYRSDGEHGIRLGEEVAIRYLQDHLREYRETIRTCDGDKHHGLTLKRRNGRRVCITPDAIHNVAPAMKTLGLNDAATPAHDVLGMSVM